MTPSSPKTGSVSEKCKILFLDDSQQRQNHFKQLLVNTPCKITWASTAKEAIAALGKRRYDVVSLDHDLATGKGFVPDYPGDIPTLQEQYHIQANAVAMQHEPDGLDVAQALVQTPNKDAMIFIHSMNPVGAMHMKQVLPNAKVLPFPHIHLEVQIIKALVNARSGR